MLAGLYWVPEAASWHLRRGEPEKAKAALTRTHGPTRMDIVQKEYDLAVYSHELDMATTAGQANVGFLEPLKKVSPFLSVRLLSHLIRVNRATSNEL